ncbi:DUF2807 domain-containing protein [Solirubrobacter ginsenosidimutans]|uniref:DUF2807 domain-containing protein n=1 Tax=Solirubrobacter ginsenosidimutans TaxID=490573 RepID=A0A9X3MNX6_9ACTN|nr:head GIN domain-containing protein [Solirubrobacter ginsenosidimutans]MDA0160101.1 DUF2807 domain-containing protein [Solirubrobacter ginsenosidimutans]
MSSPRRSVLLVPIAVGAVLLTGCALSDDGPMTSQNRDVAGFTRIDNQDSVDVRLHVGGPQRLQVRAGRKVIDDVRTDVRDGTLHLTFDHDSGIGGSNVVVEATVPKLTGIEASGSGDVDADGIDADALQVRSDGSADISLDGKAGRLALALDGSGDANATALTARDANVAVGGSGDARVRAESRLDAKVDGSGTIHYHGHPAVTKRVDGSGEVKPD